MWVRENTTKGEARLVFFEPRAAEQAAKRIPFVMRCWGVL